MDEMVEQYRHALSQLAERLDEIEGLMIDPMGQAQVSQFRHFDDHWFLDRMKGSLEAPMFMVRNGERHQAFTVVPFTVFDEGTILGMVLIAGQEGFEEFQHNVQEVLVTREDLRWLALGQHRGSNGKFPAVSLVSQLQRDVPWIRTASSTTLKDDAVTD